MDSAGRTLVLPAWVSPFGHLRLITPACGWPELFAACHVLHRLLLPRHPPCALSSLTIKFTQRSALSHQLLTENSSRTPRNLIALFDLRIADTCHSPGTATRTRRSLRHS